MRSPSILRYSQNHKSLVLLANLRKLQPWKHSNINWMKPVLARFQLTRMPTPKNHASQKTRWMFPSPHGTWLVIVMRLFKRIVLLDRLKESNPKLMAWLQLSHMSLKCVTRLKRSNKAPAARQHPASRKMTASRNAANKNSVMRSQRRKRTAILCLLLSRLAARTLVATSGPSGKASRCPPTKLTLSWWLRIKILLSNDLMVTRGE